MRGSDGHLLNVSVLVKPVCVSRNLWNDIFWVVLDFIDGWNDKLVLFDWGSGLDLTANAYYIRAKKTTALRCFFFKILNVCKIISKILFTMKMIFKHIILLTSSNVLQFITFLIISLTHTQHFLPSRMHTDP